MGSELHEINVTLSHEQKVKIRNAFINRGKIRLRLTKGALKGSNSLLVPTRFFEEMDNEDGINAIVGEQTEKEMRKEWKNQIDELKGGLKNCKDDLQETLQFHIDMEEEKMKYNTDQENEKMEKYSEKIKANMDESLKFFKDQIDNLIDMDVWGYYGLFFYPAIYMDSKFEGIEFNLDYSLMNDEAKDFVKNNIKKLFK